MFTIALYFSSVAASEAQPYPDRTVPIPSWKCEFMNVNNGCPEGQKCSISGICVCDWMEQTGCPVGQVCSAGSVCVECSWGTEQTGCPVGQVCSMDGVCFEPTTTTSTTSTTSTTKPTASFLICEFMSMNDGCPEGQTCSVSGICECDWMEQTGCPVGQVCSIGSVCGEPWSPPETTRPTDATCQEEFDTSAALNDAGAQSDCEKLDGCTWTADSGPFSETNKGTCVTTETSFLFSAARRDAGPARRPPTPRVGNDAMTMSVVVAALLTLV